VDPSSIGLRASASNSVGDGKVRHGLQRRLVEERAESFYLRVMRLRDKLTLPDKARIHQQVEFGPFRITLQQVNRGVADDLKEINKFNSKAIIAKLAFGHLNSAEAVDSVRVLDEICDAEPR